MATTALFTEVDRLYLARREAVNGVLVALTRALDRIDTVYAAAIYDKNLVPVLRNAGELAYQLGDALAAWGTEAEAATSTRRAGKT